MFAKFFFAALISMFAVSAYSSESTFPGRYRVDGPNNSGNADTQAGRYRASSGTSTEGASQAANSWAQIGQSRMAGRYTARASEYAAVPVYNAAPVSQNTNVPTVVKSETLATLPERK